MSLTPKQQRFVEEYILDFNATKAAMRAGYSKKSSKQQGARLLTNAFISDEIRRIQTERRNAAIMEYDEACSILSSIARGRVSDYLGESDRIDIRRIRESNPSAVQSIQHEMRIDGPNDNPQYIHITKFKLHSPIQAIQTLAKMKGWEHAQKVDVTVERSFAEFVLAAAGDTDLDDLEPEG